TTTSHGRLILNLFASPAEFEPDVILERTQASLSAARARGRKGGRPKGLSRAAESTAYVAETLYREDELSARQIAEKLRISGIFQQSPESWRQDQPALATPCGDCSRE